MGKKKRFQSDEEAQQEVSVWLSATKSNIEDAVQDFVQRWIPLPRLTLPCEVMDQGQLRDAMGLRFSFDFGDPWPAAEHLLLQKGFTWHLLGGSRVMYLREREDCIDAGYAEAEEVSG